MNGQLITLLRYNSGLSQYEFAKKVGLSYSTLSKIEAGISPVTKLTKWKIYRVCQIDSSFMELVKRMEIYDKLLDGEK